MKKRCLSLLLVLCLCLSLMPMASAAGTEIVVTPSSDGAKVGDTITVSVALDGNPGVAAVEFALTYDKTVLECTDVETGTVLAGMMAATNPDAKDGAIVAAASATEKTKDGTLAIFTFQVIGEGDPNFALLDALLSSAKGEDVNFTVSGVPEKTTQPETPSAPPATTPTTPTTPPATPVTPPAGTGKPDAGKPEEAAKETFTDTAKHPYREYIDEAVELGLFQGYADGSFGPERSVTRGAFVTVLWRMAGKPEPNKATPFTDIGKVSTEFQLAIAWAYEKGLINGRTATTFAPSDPVSRQAALKILYQYNGGQSNVNPLYLPLYQGGFTDCQGKADWIQNAMFWGYYNDMVDEVTDNTLEPAAVATRSQLAKMFVKFTEQFGD